LTDQFALAENDLLVLVGLREGLTKVGADPTGHRALECPEFARRRGVLGVAAGSWSGARRGEL
jgi:hypothetical protein